MMDRGMLVNSEFQSLRQQLNDQLAIMFEQDGFSPLVGRIFSLLLFSPTPLGLQEMADELGVTKAAISVQVRTLESGGLCFRLARGNDRKDYYHIADDFSLTVIKSSMMRMKAVRLGLEHTIEAYSKLEAVGPDEAESYRTSLRRFREMNVLYGLMFERLEGFEEEFRRRRELLDSTEG
jgi:HTH-type transcriptional regulator, osmoprotectant uptake regulator